MHSLCRQRVPACIYHQRHAVPGDEARVHTPRGRVSKTGDRETSIREAHPRIIARRSVQ
jgi:hypothetical protein